MENKILVYGAGPLGTLFAAKLKQGGNNVTILARGKRLGELQSDGIILKEFHSGEISHTSVRVIEKLEPDDTYDLVMVIMRKNSALAILDILKQNKTRNILFLMNNFDGPAPLVEALGSARVLTGFPFSAGYREDNLYIVLTGTQKHPYAIPFGEVDGRITERTRRIASIIGTMPGYRAEIRGDMDTWLKYHVALLFPAMAPALFAVDLDKFRLARTRDLVVLVSRGIREAFRVLKTKGLPVTPSSLRMFTWLPEPILVAGFKRKFESKEIDIAMIGHARNIGDEITHLLNEYLEFKKTSKVETPAIDRFLKSYFDRQPIDIADGSKEIPLHWGGFIACLLGLAGIITGITLLVTGLF